MMVTGLEETLAIRLLREVLVRGRLTYRLATVFIESGHDELSQAVSQLNLWDAIPTSLNAPQGGPPHSLY